MKRLVCLLLLLSLLCGCSDPTTSDTTPTSDPAKNHRPQLEEFSLEDYKPLAICSMGQNVLLVEKQWLILFDSADFTPIAGQKLSGLPSPDSGLLWVSNDGVAYYHEGSRSIIFLNADLHQTLQLELPKDMIGSAWLSPDWETVYYCTENAIRALDIGSGTSRLLKEQGAAWQSITGVFLNGTALRCEVKQADGSVRISLISTQNGALLQESPLLSTLTGQTDWYFLSDETTCVPQLIFGKAEEDPCCLWPKDAVTAWWPLPEQGLIVTARDSAVQTVLDCYSMETGQHISALFLRKKVSLSGFCACSNGLLWFYSDNTLYRWDPSQEPSADDHSYTAPLYTRETPDKTGLARIETLVQQLEQRYGIDIIFGEDTVSASADGYTFETEHVPQAYQKALDILTDAMAQFPDNFFTVAADRTQTGKLTVVLVRNIHGSAENRTLASADGIQYWLNGDPYIALSLSGDIERYFYHEMGHVIDSRVLSTTAVFYEWHKVNPPGFQYDKDYITNLDRDDNQYLVGDDRWFIDTYSMSFEIEDRSRIFEYASLPGNEEFFSSAHMQTKLKRICNGIRQSFGLENDQTFIWEQYLK